jgi:signal transduction histidine kinase/BarA-like signal transduction histidine kinase
MSDMPKPALSRAKILVVDDEAHGRLALNELLQGPDREVVLASSGAEALRAAGLHDFALVLLDVRMPGMDGFETAGLIHACPRSQRTPVIFLTGAYEDMASVMRGYAAGAVDYVVKPVQPDMLRSKVAVFVDLYYKSAELARQIAERNRAEEALSRANEQLEAKVRERTLSLTAANERLRREIEIRRNVEDELRQAKQAAESANRAKTEFLANMSHEIRTPMNVVVGMTELALQANLSEDVREYLGAVKTASESLLGIIDDILDLSRIEAGQLAIEATAFSLRGCVGGTLKALAFQARQKELELTSEIASDVPDDLIGDPLRLRQIVMNLVSNAIKFTEHGQVKVGIALDSRSDRELVCRFCVSDTGIGIPRDRQGAIFRRFLQADPSTTRLYGGSGLGLTISARLVGMMQGRIWVESEPEQGSAFHFTARFALQPEAGRSPDAASAGSAANTDAGDTRAICPAGECLDILLVEDNALSQKLACHLLRRQGHEVWVADNGVAALEAYEQRRFDLILMDVRMPRMDGLAATERIRQKEKRTGSHVPIIALTANAMVGDREDCLQAGMDDCLIKPIQPAALLAAIERARSAHSRAAETGPVLDRTALLERVGGDMTLLEAMKDVFRRDSTRLLSQARCALDQGDAPGLHQALHTLSGMFRNLSAHAACHAVGRLQRCDVQCDPAGAAATLADLVRQVEALKAALAVCHAWQPHAAGGSRPWSAGDGRIL